MYICTMSDYKENSLKIFQDLWCFADINAIRKVVFIDKYSSKKQTTRFKGFTHNNGELFPLKPDCLGVSIRMEDYWTSHWCGTVREELWGNVSGGYTLLRSWTPPQSLFHSPSSEGKYDGMGSSVEIRTGRSLNRYHHRQNKLGIRRLM